MAVAHHIKPYVCKRGYSWTWKMITDPVNGDNWFQNRRVEAEGVKELADGERHIETGTRFPVRFPLAAGTVLAVTLFVRDVRVTTLSREPMTCTAFAQSSGEFRTEIPGHPLWLPELDALLKHHERYDVPYPYGEPVCDMAGVIADWLRDHGLDGAADGVMEVDRRFLPAYFAGLRSETIRNHVRELSST